MVIRVAETIGHCFTYEEGLRLQEAIRASLKKTSRVYVSFQGVFAVASSFVNGAFVPLVNDYGTDVLRERVVICDSNRIINDVIRGRIQDETSEESAAKETCLVS